MGQPLKKLIEDCGYPSSSSYDYIDEDDPDLGEYGMLYYVGFTVKTRRDSSGETIISVTPNEAPAAASPSTSA